MKEVRKRPLNPALPCTKRLDLILGMNLSWHDMTCWDDIPDLENASQHTPKSSAQGNTNTNTKEKIKSCCYVGRPFDVQT